MGKRERDRCERRSGSEHASADAGDEVAIVLRVEAESAARALVMR
jgi:hypothetical protein